jgi:hypothetical protein
MLNLCRVALTFLPGTVLLSALAAPAPAQDKTVLGVEIGAQFRVPACGPGGEIFPARHCFNRAPIHHKASGASEYQVTLPSAGTPAYVRGDIKVFVIAGLVESVQVATWGIEAQPGVLTSLTQKYGEPTRATQQKLKGMRSRFPTHYLEWDFRDFSVKYDGTTGSIDWGRIVVSTHRYRKLVEAHEKRPPG